MLICRPSASLSEICSGLHRLHTSDSTNAHCSALYWLPRLLRLRLATVYCCAFAAR
jgi:hypothetical protein